MCILIIGSVGCSSVNKIVEEETNKDIKDFIGFMNYKVTEESEFVEKYTLTDKKIENLPYNEIWRLQRASFKDFMNKDIEVYKIIVNNHRLSNLPQNKLMETEVFIMFSDGHIIGGYSIPKIESVGDIYSIDGLNPDEFKSELRVHSVVETDETKKDIIAKEVYVEYIKGNSTDWRFVEENKLDRDPVATVLDYRIDSIHMYYEGDDFFTANIGYDVQASNEKSGWYAGTGEDGSDNWIINKSNIFDVMKVGKNKYVILRQYN